MTDKTKVIGPTTSRVGWLATIRGKRVGQVFQLVKVNTLGRDEVACDIVIDEDTASAQHARIKLERGRFVLYDLASANGTFLNGKLTQRSLLEDNDEIVIGRTRLVFKEVSPA
jgi:DNA segregation ATPase FtsK/SpoIIIE, S-DNA-T family